MGILLIPSKYKKYCREKQTKYFKTLIDF